MICNHLFIFRSILVWLLIMDINLLWLISLVRNSFIGCILFWVHLILFNSIYLLHLKRMGILICILRLNQLYLRQKLFLLYLIFCSSICSLWIKNWLILYSNNLKKNKKLNNYSNMKKVWKMKKSLINTVSLWCVNCLGYSLTTCNCWLNPIHLF